MNTQNPFTAIDRLYGTGASERLAHSACMVIGLGGVGSWAVEALARSGVGRLILVDLDEICHSNLNRQIHTLQETLGRSKAEVMAERVRGIHTELHAEAKVTFFTDQTAASLLDCGADVVIDAIDSLKMKCLLLDLCRQRGQHVVTVGGAGGRIDPAQVQTEDLTRSWNDPLLQKVRKRLRQKHGFPRNTRKRWGIPCVFSAEPVRYPHPDGSVSVERPEEMQTTRLDCFSGFGSAAYVTGTFGMAAAAEAVRLLLKDVETS